MKFLILHVFAHKHPGYIIPAYLNVALGYHHRLHKIIPSIGKEKTHLFGPKAYDGIEFDVEHTGVVNKKTWQIDHHRLDRLLKQNLAPFSVHGVFPPGEYVRFDRVGQTLNLAFVTKEVQAGIKTHIHLTKLIVKKPHPLLVFHPGIASIETSQEELINNVVTNLQSCLQDLEKTNITICLENLAPISPHRKIRAVSDDIYILKEIITHLNHPQIKVVYDWGHANASARVYYENHKEHLDESYLTEFKYHKELIKELGKDIVYLHLNYNPAHIPEFNLSRRARMLGWDFHNGLNHLHGQAAQRYKEVLFELYVNSGLKKYDGKILLEINPKGLTKYFGMGHMGATEKDAIDSVELLRKWFEEFEQAEKEENPRKAKVRF